MGDVLRELAERIVDGKTVGFIGAGASIRSGYPLWGSLLDGLYDQAQAATAERLEPRSKDDDLRWLAQYYSTALRGKTELADAVQEVFTSRELRGPTRFHERLASLPINHFVTTNYDDLVEDACNSLLERRKGRELEVQEKCRTLNGIVDKEFSLFLRGLAEDSGPRSVLHLHGALRLRDITLSLADYGDQYMQEAMPDRIYTIFATSTVVFIGSSLTDPDIMSLILRSNFHGEKKTRHYAFLPSGYERFDDVLKDNYGIQPIRYQVVHHDDGSQDHSDLDLQLTRLVEYVEERLFAAGATQNGVPLEPVKGNAPPVTSAVVSPASIEAIKNGIRGHDNGLVTFSHSDKVESSRLLRNVAVDYRNLPARYRFKRVVFLSPSRLGLFPEHDGPRTVVHSMIGETVRALGHQSLTSTVDPRRNISALRDVLTADEHCAGGGGQVTLFVIEEASSILEAEKGLLNEVVTNLPAGSLVVREFTPSASHALGAAPWEERKWRGLWHAVDAEGADHDASSERTHRALDAAMSSTADGAEQGRRLLCALAILANPASAEEITAMTGMAPFEIEESAAALAGAGLLETEYAPERGPDGAVPPRHGLGRLDVVSQVRWAVLERVLKELGTIAEDGNPAGELARQFERTVAAIFRWAEAKMHSLKDWEHDTRQSRHLNIVLPNLLTAYEAADWLAAAKRPRQSPVSAAAMVQVGIQLAYTLFSLGRWGEAVEYTEHLTELSKPLRRDHPTLLARVQILRSRMLAFTSQGQKDYALAARIVTDDFPKPSDSEDDALESSEEYALLAQRARIRQGVALFRSRRLGTSSDALKAARGIFEGVCEAVFAEDSLEGVLPEDRKLHDMALMVHAEAAEYLTETIFAPISELEPSSKRPPPDELPRLLKLLDRQREALFQREDRRGIGHHWRLRGDVLLTFKGPAVARRYFSRALVVAYEFRDRLLEAGARLGLARCDHRRQEADRAAEIYLALDLPGMALRAEAFAQTLPVDTTIRRLRPVDRPRLVLFFGAPESGRSTALRATARVLTQWGLDPRTVTAGGGGVDTSGDQPPAELKARSARRTAAMDRWAALGKLDGSPAEVLEWCRSHAAQPGAEPGTLPDVLCVHLTPVLREEHRNWVWPAAGYDDPELGVLRVDTAFEGEGAAYVGINSNVPILDLEDTIRESLAYSFLSIDELLRETRDQWSPPVPWGERRAAEHAGRR